MACNTHLALATAAGLAICATPALAETVTFGTANDGVGGFTHTAISGTNSFLNTTKANSVEFRNQSTGTLDAAFIKQIVIDRTPDSGKIYTATGTFTVSDGYADDNNRLGLILFSNPTRVLSRANNGHIGIVWNTDDGSDAGTPPGSNADDDFGIYDDFEGSDLADALVDDVQRNQATPYAQDLLQGTQITMSATFWFTGTDIKIDASMTDAGGVTNVGTATVLAADYTDEYFGFVSATRARNYDGDPNPTGADRDNPLVQDYESFSLTFVPEPSSLALLGLGGLFVMRRRRG